MTTGDLDSLKKAAGLKAIEFVRDGMVVGLGTGSTVKHMVIALGERVRAGMKLRGVPTSAETAALARQSGIPLIDTENRWDIDVAIDGADQVDPHGDRLGQQGPHVGPERADARTSGQGDDLDRDETNAAHAVDDPPLPPSKRTGVAGPRGGRVDRGRRVRPVSASTRIEPGQVHRGSEGQGFRIVRGRHQAGRGVIRARPRRACLQQPAQARSFGERGHHSASEQANQRRSGADLGDFRRRPPSRFFEYRTDQSSLQADLDRASS